MIPTKILVLSDLYWNRNSKNISRADIKEVSKDGPPVYSERYRSVSAYWNLIKDEKPILVLFSGDLTGDGSCGHGFQNAFFYLLCLLELSEIPTFFIQGDNDLKVYYSQIKDTLSVFSYVKEISNRIIHHGGITILGIPFQTSNNKKQLKKLIEENEETIDIVLSHCELKRRTSMFEMDTKIIITGHFDNKLASINDKLFLSFSNDSSSIINYGTLSFSSDQSVVSYHIVNRIKNSKLSVIEDISILQKSQSSGLIYIDGMVIDITEFENLTLPSSDYEKDKNALALAIKYLRGQNYSLVIQQLIDSRAEADYEKLNSLRKHNITAKHTLSKSMILDYLGNGVRDYLK